MLRFYFHVSAPDERFRDNVGCNLSDLAAAHFRAKQIVRRVMTLSGLASHEPDWRRWTVTVTDDCQRPVLTVMFPPGCVFEEWTGHAQMNGVRASQQHLAMIWGGNQTTSPLCRLTDIGEARARRFKPGVARPEVCRSVTIA
jgi:hypothetical protein